MKKDQPVCREELTDRCGEKWRQTRRAAFETRTAHVLEFVVSTQDVHLTTHPSPGGVKFIAQRGNRL